MKNYILTNKKDITYFAIIIAVMTILYILCGNNLYNGDSDIGREFYIPSQMIKGQVLYKDIYNIYTPLGYFLNALCLKLFGNCIRTYTLIGYGLSLLTLISMYKIIKIFCKSETAFCLCIFTIFTCVYYPTLSNWITPYSYSVLYSLCSIMWAVYFILKFTENNQNKYIYYSSLLYGFSVASKYEYITFLPIILFMLVYKKSNLRVYMLSFLSMTIFPLMSLLVLFIQQCSLSDLSMALNYIIKNSSEEAIGFFYRYLGFIPSKATYFKLLKPTFDTFFSQICFFTPIMIIISIVKKYDKKVIILNFITLLLSLKCFCYIRLNVYGTYFLPILLINMCVFISQLIKGKEKILNTVIIIAILLYIMHDVRAIKEINFQTINTPKGQIKVEGYLKGTLLSNMNFIENETNKNDKIIFIAEGAIYNYLTDRDSDNYLFYLIGTNCLVFGDKMISERIKKSDIEYIVIDNKEYLHLNVTDFKGSFGKEIFNSIKEDYNIYKTFDTGIISEVYKRKRGK